MPGPRLTVAVVHENLVRVAILEEGLRTAATSDVTIVSDMVGTDAPVLIGVGEVFVAARNSEAQLNEHRCSISKL